MPLPIVTLPILERWDCHQCGVCCRGSIVPLSPQDLERLESQHWNERPEFEGVAITAPFDGKRRQLAKQRDGSCVFLMPDGLCRIHKELGLAAKPLICRMFPLQLIPREKDAVLTLRRACPSAAADKGRSVAEQLSDVQSYAAEGHLAEQGVAPPPIKPGEEADWKRSRLALEALRRVMCDERYPPIRRLVHGLELCRLLDQAKTRRLTIGKLGELMRLLEENLSSEAGRYFERREQPKGAARLLFRQIGLEVVRLHPRVYHQPTFRARLRLAWWAAKMVWGRGALPQVHTGFPSATFEQLEEPLGKLAPEMYEALDRYFQSTVSSYQYALAQKGGWSVIESFRQLALLYPLGLWLLRWVTAGREATANDLFEVIAALDRAQGYAPLLGAKQRSRIRVLARMDALPQLVAWYGR